MAKNAVKLMEDFLKQSRPEVAKELTIVTPDDIGQDRLYHIAFTRQPEMGPFISKRALPHEDNTVPRIHVAKNIEGCIRGFGGIHDIVSGEYILKKGDNKLYSEDGILANYKGGFYIHALKFEAALSPSSKLVPDSNDSGELWLVTYDENTVMYKSPIIGKMIPISVEFFPRTGNYAKHKVRVAFEIKEGETLHMSDTLSFNTGFYETVFEETARGSKHISTKAIERKQYLIYKGDSATLLSHKPIIPAGWARW